MSLSLQSIHGPLPTIELDRTTFRAKFWQVLETIMTHSTGYQCAQESCRLNALSDQELAKLGLERDEIVQYAFRKHVML